jgi:hypothetical protein
MGDPLEDSLKSIEPLLKLISVFRTASNRRSLFGLGAITLSVFNVVIRESHYPYWQLVVVPVLIAGAFLLWLGARDRFSKSIDFSKLKGASPLGPTDRALFKYLETLEPYSEVARILSCVVSEQTAVILLYGPPASGKTSAINAGLRESLSLEFSASPINLIYKDASQDDFAPSIAHEIRQNLKSSIDLPDDLENIIATDRVTREVIVLDNAERCSDRALLIRIAQSAIAAPSPYKRRFIYILDEEEYDAHWARMHWPRQGDAVQSIKMARLTPASAEIAGSILMRKSNLNISPKALKQALEDAAINRLGQKEISQLTLNVLLYTIGRISLGSRPFDLKEYERYGGVSGLMEDFLGLKLSRFPVNVWRPGIVELMSRIGPGAREIRVDEGFSPGLGEVIEQLCSVEIRGLRRTSDPDVFLILDEWFSTLLNIQYASKRPIIGEIGERLRNKFSSWQAGRLAYRGHPLLGRFHEGRLLLGWMDLVRLRRNNDHAYVGEDPAVVAFIDRSIVYRKRILAVYSALAVLLSVALSGLGYQYTKKIDKKYKEDMASAWQLPVDLFSVYGDQLEGLSFDLNVNDFKLLPRNLIWLEVHCSDLSSLQGIPLGLTHLDLRRTGVNSLEGLPSRLEDLDISGTGIESVDGLSEGIVSLNLKGMRVPDMRRIPRSVKRLKLQNPTINNLVGLPNLTDLELIGTSVDSLKALPATLQKLTLEVNPKLKSLDYDLPNLQELVTERYTPNPTTIRLRSLTVARRPLDEVGANIGKLELADSFFDGDTTRLKELKIDDERSAIPLSKLPAGLISLKVRWPVHTSLGLLPSDIKDLDISYSEDLNSLAGLTLRLTHLDVTNTNLKTLAGTPDSVTHLSFKLCHVSNLTTTFLTKLEELNLEQCDQLDSLEGVSEKLRALNVSRTLLSKLPKLSENLRTLDISNTCIRGRLPALPEGLHELTLNIGQLKTLKNLPKSVKVIHFVESVVKSPPYGCSPN